MKYMYSQHDSMCPAPLCKRCLGTNAYCPLHDCICEVARPVRADMLAKCIEAVLAYADERLDAIKVNGQLPAAPSLHEAVVAALRVAASRLEALGEQQ